MMSKAIFDALPKEQQDVDHGGRRGAGEIRHRRRPRPTTRRSPRSTPRGRQGRRPRRGERRQVAGHRARHRLEGLRATRPRLSAELLKLAEAVQRRLIARHQGDAALGLDGIVEPSMPARSGRGAVGRAARRVNTADRHRVVDRAASRPRCADLQRRRPLFLQRRPIGRTRSGLPARRRDVHVGGLVQARRGHVAIEAIVGLLPPAVEPRPASAGRHRQPRVLRLFRLEILDAAARSLGRRTSHRARPGRRRCGFPIR